MTNRSYLRSLGLFLAVTGMVGAALGQAPHGRGPGRGGNGPKAQPAELAALKKTCSFPVVTLPPPRFFLLYAFSAAIPAGFYAKGSPASQAILLVYSHVGEHGGPISMYEAPPQAGMTPDQVILKVANAHIFKDIPHTKGWVVKPLLVGNTVVGPSSWVGAAVDDSVALLKR